MLDLRPNKWLKNSRLPIIDDIVLFIFNDSEYNKGGMDWRLGKITAVRNPGICYQLCEGFQSKGTPMHTVSVTNSVRGSKAKVPPMHTVQKSARDISILYSTGDLLVNTREYFSAFRT